MGRNIESKSGGLGRLVKRIFSRHHEADEPAAAEAAPARSAAPRTAESGTTRTVRRQTDIPLDVLDRSYTPPATSSKSSFRSDGADHHQDQEFSRGVADAGWNDEDHFTNKSGDPRIGTRRRSYEPNETVAESRDEQR
jgi:hypothetical protein